VTRALADPAEVHVFREDCDDLVAPTSFELSRSSGQTGARVTATCGECNVSSAQEFYDNADEHFGWAESAKTERERAMFFQMAAAWLEVAQRWETTDAKRSDSSGFSLGTRTVEGICASTDRGGPVCAKGSI
jgi:hypothetical protein